MATDLEDTETGELWPMEERDPELIARMRAHGIRPATRSLYRPRRVVRPRPSWLAFLLRLADAVAALGRRVLGIRRNPSRRDLKFDQQLREIWPRPHLDPEERVAPLVVHPATRSLDRPRYVARRRPTWLAFLLRLLDAVAEVGRRILGIQRKPSRDDLELDLQLSEIWPVPERDPEVAERMRAAGIRLATDSLDRPRQVAKPRPAWAAFLLTMLRVRS